LRVFRYIAALVPQVLFVLIVGARFDLLCGFNRTDAGFSTLLYLLVSAPAVTLVWLILEMVPSVRLLGQRDGVSSCRLPGLAFFIFLESAGMVIYMALHFRM